MKIPFNDFISRCSKSLREAKIGYVAVGLDDMREFRKKYPRVLCVQADGCALPFKNDALAVAFSNAVLEHISVSKQLHFVEEISRAACHEVVLAVPDRLSPIEIHSRIFFLHWLPIWRQLYRKLGEYYWSSEQNLAVIFSRKTLASLLQKNPICGCWKIERQFFLFIPVSLIAIFSKDHHAYRNIM
ncbi:MAG: class I SAM-dependent methyltransferase [Anaerolineales bacterium]